MQSVIDTAQCSGHARCHAVGPDVHLLDDGGYALPYEGVVPPELEERAREGVEACPERAISFA